MEETNNPMNVSVLLQRFMKQSPIPVMARALMERVLAPARLNACFDRVVKVQSFHLHVQLGCIAQGLLQHLAINHTVMVWHHFRSWLRTIRPELPPSELIVASALRSSLPGFLASSTPDSNLEKIIQEFQRHEVVPDSMPVAA